MKKRQVLKKIINCFTLRMAAIAAAALSCFLAAPQAAGRVGAAASASAAGPQALSFGEGCAWFAFTVFSFLLATGYEMSSDRYIYAKRLLIFALLAEIPFDLLNYGYLVSSHGQNAIFALLVALSGMYICDSIKISADNSVISLLADGAVCAASYFICSAAHVEPGAFAVIVPYIFCVSRELSYPRLFQFAAFFALCSWAVPGAALYVAAAVLLCWLSTGERGPNALWLRYLFYASYPLTLLACWLIR